jgi:hypothetical protein
MSIDAKHSAPEQPAGFIHRILQHRHLRICLLIGVAIFELGFIWFIQHFGWMESVNIWTQIGVVFAAFSPLIIALVVMARKRFKLSSMMVAFSLIAVFMGLSMRPVYEARQARVPTKLLLDLDVRIGDSSYEFKFNEGLPDFAKTEADKQQSPDWVLRMLGEYADVDPVERVLSVSIQNERQLEAFAEVGEQFPDLSALSFDTNLSSTALNRHAEFISGLNLRSIGFQNFENYGSTEYRV